MKRRPRRPGVLVVDKPAGSGSRQIVDLVMRTLGTRRVGHAGTLDPFARGVLLVAWGKATALVPYLQEYEKSYEALVRFGRVTDTQDRTGTTVEERDASGLTREAVEAALPRFRGWIEQVPPMYSALKHGGKRLHELARRGETVERAPRRRRVHRLELTAWEPPLARLSVTCSAGTYVRTLAHDLGREVGTGACLEELTRVAVGPHSVEGAVPVERLERLSAEELLELGMDPRDALPDWPVIRVPREEIRGVLSGAWRPPGSLLEPRYRLLDETDRLLALAEGGSRPRLLRVLAEKEGDA